MPDRSWGKTFAALALGIGLALATPSSAEDAEPDPDSEEGHFSQNGVYLIGTASYAFPNQRGNLSDGARRRQPGSSVDIDGTWGVGGRLGYRLHPRAAVEGQFELLNSIDITANNGSSRLKDELRAFSVTGNAKGYFATGRFQPYALLGAGWMRTRLKPELASSRRNNGFTARFGGGIDIYGSPDVALTLESTYVLATGGTDDLDNVTLSAGLMLRFYPLD